MICPKLVRGGEAGAGPAHHPTEGRDMGKTRCGEGEGAQDKAGQTSDIWTNPL